MPDITPSAMDIIKMAYGQSTNFMTPNIMRYGKIHRNIAYELSSGEGIDRQPIYGVSFAVYIPTQNRAIRAHGLSKGGFSLIEAEKYIRTVIGRCHAVKTKEK